MLTFLKENKIYFLLLVLSVAASILLPFDQEPAHYEEGKSPALREFQKAEEKVNKKIESKTEMENFLESRPDLDFGVRFFTILILVAFFAGIAINIRWLFNPSMRENFKREEPFQFNGWNFSMFFRVCILFYAGSLVLAVLLGWLEKIAGFKSAFNLYTLLHTTVIDFLCLALMVWAIQAGSGSWRDLGFRTQGVRILKELKFAVSAYLAVIPLFVTVLVLLMAIIHFISYEPPAHPLVNVFLEEEERSPWLVSYSVFLAIVIGPILEEVFFRGFCYPIFKKQFGIKLGMVISATLFAAIHANVFAFFPILILGVALAYVYEYRKSLYAPIFIHIFHNSIFITYFFFAKNFVQTAAS